MPRGREKGQCGKAEVDKVQEANCQIGTNYYFTNITAIKPQILIVHGGFSLAHLFTQTVALV
jgi:hypothetical protein